MITRPTHPLWNPLTTSRTIAASAIFFTFLLAPSLVSALPIIERGFVSRESGSPYLIDRQNNRVWLGWDITKGLSYSETLDAIGDGGAWEGFKVAYTADARMFASALGLNGDCPIHEYWGPVCGMGTISGLESLLGENYADSTAWLGIQDHDYVWFLAEDDRGERFGSLEMSTVYRDNLELFSLYDYRLDISIADAIGTDPENPVGWLLYRNSVDLPAGAVSEPPAIALVLLASVAALATRRKSRARSR